SSLRLSAWPAYSSRRGRTTPAGMGGRRPRLLSCAHGDRRLAAPPRPRAGRYFRENFAQAGIDLSQVIPELVTNADAAIAAAGRGRGRIHLRLGPADPGLPARLARRPAHARAAGAARLALRARLLRRRRGGGRRGRRPAPGSARRGTGARWPARPFRAWPARRLARPGRWAHPGRPPRPSG